MNALLGEHALQEVAHGVLDLFSGEDAYSVCLFVDVKVYVWKVIECALVMLGLEAEVALDKDEDWRDFVGGDGAQGVDVVCECVELALGV